MLGRRRAASTGTPLVTTLPQGTWAPWTATTGRPDPGLVGTACLVVLTLGISAATLRYRLYDLDRIISRTLAYGLLTVLLGLGYAGIVLGLGRLLPQGSSLAVAAATLAVAAVFQPARRRIQQTVDRRFNRHRHDAGQTIAAFSARLRNQVDLDTLTAELLTVVDQTMQPTQASLWLRPQALSTTAAGPAMVGKPALDDQENDRHPRGRPPSAGVAGRPGLLAPRRPAGRPTTGLGGRAAPVVRHSLVQASEPRPAGRRAAHLPCASTVRWAYWPRPGGP
jgi:hypothetical protein